MKEAQQSAPAAMVWLMRLVFLLFMILMIGYTAPYARAAAPAMSAAVSGQSSVWSKILRLPQSTQTEPAVLPEDLSLIPLGHTMGIKLFADGVMVIDVVDITTDEGAFSPAASAGLRAGDVITHINSTQLESIEQVREILMQQNGAAMTLRVERDGKTMQLSTAPALDASDQVYKLGAWIRDSMGGIGTATFYDPATGTFGALGHGIADVDTQLLMPIASGAVMYSTVTGVTVGERGAPGQLHGAFRVNEEIGSLTCNTDAGVFGTLCCERMTANLSPVPVAANREIQVGDATILSNVAGDAVEEYAIEIMRIYPDDKDNTRNMMIKVTDERLLAATGGIVQGMSGSPILQNGKLVGAVTHVLVSDPTTGYGIFIDNMLDEAFPQLQERAS